MRRFVSRRETHYSLGVEELLVRHFFGDRRDGVFAEVGAGDWRAGSNTLYLERHLGWSGIAVDAREDLAAGWREHRPGTRFERYIVGDRTGATAPFYISGFFGATSRARLPDFEGVDAAGALETWAPTITLTDLLDACGIERVDFVSIDVEHAEGEVLAGFALERFAPELVCVEIGVCDPERSVTPHFTAAGYRRIDAYSEIDGVNWWFARRNGAPLAFRRGIGRD